MIFKKVIKKKRDGKALTENEIRQTIELFLKDSIPDYQMSAMLMAIFFRGLNNEEMLYLTDAMLKSGKQLRFKTDKPILDKHSTGGIGDKVSMVFAPVMAEMGFSPVLLAGRGLGFTGGTIDKLESTGMKVELTQGEIEESLKRFGFCISSQTRDIAPADKRIYALRDATATVESIPLIVSSILSKKLAVNSKSIVFDVKVGSGAFAKDLKQARKLANSLVNVSKLHDKKAAALITDMNQPLGRTVGNAVEILEVSEALKGNISDDLLEVTTSLIGLTYLLLGKDYDEGKNQSKRIILSGKAFERFKFWVEWLGGSLNLHLAKSKLVKSPVDGFIEKFDGEKLGYLLIDLGGGRRKEGENIDYSVGFRFFKKIGDQVKKGETIAEMLYNGNENLTKKLLSYYTFSNNTLKKPRLVKEKVL